MTMPGDAKLAPTSRGLRGLQSIIDAPQRLDELGMARLIEHAAEAVHKAQAGKALGTLTPSAIEVAPDGHVVLAPAGHPAPPAYTAPERLRGAPGDRRSDVFALGVILWEALAHARLFTGDADAATASVLAGSVRAPSEVNANVPAELDAICGKALAPEPAARFPSAKVMAAELGAVLEDAGYPPTNEPIATYLAATRRPGSDTLPPPMPTMADVPLTAMPRTTTTSAVAPPMPQPVAAPVVLMPAAREPTPATPMPAIVRPRDPLAQTMLGMQPLKADGGSPPPVAASTPVAPPVPAQASPGEAHATAAPALPDWATRPARASEPPPVTEIVLPPPPESPTVRAAAATVAPAREPVASTVPGLMSVLREPAEPTREPADRPSRATVQGSASLSEALARLNAAAPEGPAAVPPDVAAALARHADPITTAETAATPAFIANAPVTAVDIPPALTAPAATASPTAPARVAAASDGPPEMPAPLAAGSMRPHDDDRAPSAARPGLAVPAAAVDPAAVVALAGPRRDSRGDMLSSWEWKTDSHTAIPEEDDVAVETSLATRRRIKIAAASVGGGILLIAIIVLAAGGGDAPKRPVTRRVSSFAPAPPLDAAPELHVATLDAALLAPIAAPDAAIAIVLDAAAPAAVVAVPVDAAVIAVAPPPAMPAATSPAPPPRPPAAAKVAAKQPDPRVTTPKPPAAKASAPSDPRVTTPRPPPKAVTARPVDPYAEPSKPDASAAYRTGIQQFARGDAAGALQTFKSSAAANPRHAPTWRGMGMAYEKLGNATSARSAFAKYLRLAPTAPDAAQIRARMEKL